MNFFPFIIDHFEPDFAVRDVVNRGLTLFKVIPFEIIPWWPQIHFKLFLDLILNELPLK